MTYNDPFPPPAAAAAATAFFDEDAYISQIKEDSLAKEACIFSTAHCPQGRFLLGSSNQGRLAIWDLSSYLYPSSSSSSSSAGSSSSTPHAPASSSHTHTSSSLHLNDFRRELQINEARLYPPSLLRQGWPCLSLQVSRRAINTIVFLGKDTQSPLLVLAGDDGIYTWPWATLLKLLLHHHRGGEGGGGNADVCTTIHIGLPSSTLKALPSQKAWPFLTESNQVTPAATDPSRLLFSACGDSLVRLWDVETAECTQLLVGHTGYVHAVKSLGAETTAPNTLISGAEDGKVGVWDVRKKGHLLKMLDGWEGGGNRDAATSAAASTGGAAQAGGGLPSSGSGGNLGLGGGGGSSSSLSVGGSGGVSSSALHTSSWVAALDVDRGGNFLVAGGGVECLGGGPGGKGMSKFGFLSVFHLPSFSLLSSATADSFVQDLCFHDDKIICAGNEEIVTHFSRPGLEGRGRVTTDIPSVFAINARDGPPVGDGVTIYAGRSDNVSVFVSKEHCAFNLKFR